MLLSRMADSGELERVAHGVYATPSAVGHELTEKRALWLSLEPQQVANERLVQAHLTGVISHASAAVLHEAGDILEPRLEVTLPRRYRARRPAIQVHRGGLDPSEVTLVGGLPVTTPQRTLADLLRQGQDRDHVASLLRDMVRQGSLRTARLRGGLSGIKPVTPGLDPMVELLELAGIEQHGWN